jgi:LmbE family N-acetylglucosaminyl deacetylase
VTNSALTGVRRVLCLGAHSDDIEIGCGGTILKLLRDNPGLEVWWVVFGAAGVRGAEAEASARHILRNAARKEIIIHSFRDGFFPFVGDQIKDVFEKIKGGFAPDLIFTHYRDDLHQDHRMLSQFAWNTFRSHLILEYEIPKYDGDLGAPNAFVPLPSAICEKKIKLLLKAFASQRNKHWFTRDLFLSLMRLRGMECNAPSSFAEAFYCRKLILS